MDSEQPALLAQDLNIRDFMRCSPADFARVKAETGKQPTTLEEWVDVIDFYFASYGPKAVAVKCAIAYSRPLDFAPVAKAHAARLFLHQIGARGHSLGSEDLKALQDFLFRYCVSKAGEYGLPVKLHTGYLAGGGQNGTQPYSRQRGGSLSPVTGLSRGPIRSDAYRLSVPGGVHRAG